jgi:hypothetical protein
VFKCVIKIVLISSKPFSLLIFNVRILSNFQKEWCTFGRKKNIFFKKQGLFIFDVWVLWTCNFLNLFVSSFEHVKFSINGKYSQKIMTIQIIMLRLWYFKHAKMQF